jgi:DNA repair protein RecO (recombination protein O)
MIDATFRESPPMHNKYIEVSDAQTVVALSRMTWENLHVFKFTREQRNATLDEILRYYTLHYSRLSDLSSLDVVRTLFT